MTFDLRVIVCAALSGALLIIKRISFKCKTLLNDHSLLCENLNELRSYIWNWQT